MIYGDKNDNLEKTMNFNEIMMNENKNKNNYTRNLFEKNDNIIKEKILNEYPLPITLKQNEKIIEQLRKTICYICLENGDKATGFFIKIKFPDNEHLLPFLVTCNHLIDESILKEKEINIKLNGEMKYIKFQNRIIYTNREYDITFIEIKENEDKIKDFLAIDEENQDASISGETIYILQYFNREPSVSFGILKRIDKSHNFFIHFCCSKSGSSGSPILNLTNNKVIGIHIGSNEVFNYNIGTFLNNPIADFINKNYYNKIEENKIIKITNNEIKKIHLDYLKKFRKI